MDSSNLNNSNFLADEEDIKSNHSEEENKSGIQSVRSSFANNNDAFTEVNMSFNSDEGLDDEAQEKENEKRKKENIDVEQEKFRRQLEREQQKNSELLHDALKRQEQDEKFKAMDPGEQLLATMKDYAINYPGYQELIKDAKVTQEAYKKAYNDQSTSGDVKNLAVAGFQLHRKFAELLNRLENDNRERFENNTTVANLKMAFNLNAEICARSIEAAKGDIFNELLRKEIQNTVSLGRDEKEGSILADREAFNESLARTLYIAKLKAEFDRVHGNEEEQKAWRSEILNELLSDRFETNLRNFKESGFFKNAVDSFPFVPDEEFSEEKLHEGIDECIHRTAEDLYHGVYGYFNVGANTEQEKAEVDSAVTQIEELKTIGDSFVKDLKMPKSRIDLDNDPCMDTQHIIRRTKLYGEYKLIPVELRHEKEYAEFVINRKAEVSEKLVNEFKKKHEELKKEIDSRADFLKVIDNLNGQKQVVNQMQKKIDEIDNMQGLSEKDKAETKSTFESLKNSSEQEVKKLGEKIGTVYPEIYAKYQQYKAEEENYNVYITKCKVRANQLVDENKNLTEEFDKNEKDDIIKEAPEYKKAKEKGDTETLNKIKKSRLYREYRIQDRYPEVYEKTSFGGNKTAISLPHNVTSANLEKTYSDYKQKYGTTEEQDKEVKDSLTANNAVNKAIENRKITKPDRTGQKIISYVLNNNINMPENREIDMNAINVGIYDVYMAEEPDEPLFNFGIENNPEADIKVAFDYVNATKDAFLGTQEYANILQDLVELKGNLQNGNPQELMQKTRQIIASMNFYIARKTDEKNFNLFGERKVAKGRRNNMTLAKSQMEIALQKLEAKYGLEGKDYALEDATAGLEAALRIARVNVPGARELLETMKKGNKAEAAAAMENYLNKNVGNYLKKNGYYFKLHDETEPGKKFRLPAGSEGRVFKAVLLGFEKLEASYLKDLAKSNPVKFEEEKFRVKSLGSVDDNAPGLNKKFGINIVPGLSEQPILLKDTYEEYKKQFKDNYDICRTKQIYTNLEDRIKNPKTYRPGRDIEIRDAGMLIQAGLSQLFFEQYERKGMVAEQFDCEALDAERSKFIGMLQKSSVYKNIEKRTKDWVNLKEVQGGAKEFKKAAEQRMDQIATPTQFLHNVVVPSVADTLSREIEEVMDMLAPGSIYKKAELDKRLESIDYNIKLSTALGVRNDVDNKVQKMLKENGLKGTSIEDTMRKIQVAARDSLIRKKVEPAKNIKLN